MYIRLIDGEPIAYNLVQLRQDNPQVSFPDAPSAECLEEFGVFAVLPAAAPATSIIERAVSRLVEEDGAWVQQWAVEPLPVEQAKAVLWARAKDIRESMADAPGSMATTSFGTVQVDAKSKQNINGLVTMALIAKGAGATFSEPFTLADNSTVVLDADQMIGLGVAVGQHVADVYSRARELRAAIDAAADAEALAEIDIAAGWP